MTEDIKKYRNIVTENMNRSTPKDKQIPNNAIGTLSFTVGRLYISMVRKFLEEICFNYNDVTFFEGSGLFEHEFKVKGPVLKLKALRKMIKEHFGQDFEDE